VLILFQSIDHLASTQRQDPIILEPKAVHLWGVDLDGSSQCMERCAGWLDARERERAARLVHAEDRRHYVLAHGGLRTVLSRYLGVAPSVVALDRRNAGKPFVTTELRDQSAITFNLSHAHGRALIGVSKAQEVGVDLEFIRSDVEVANLAERYFTRSEYASIMQSAEEQRATRFFRYWVAKEAVLKAQGIGLQGLTRCEIVLGTDEVDGEIEVRLGAPVQNGLRVCLLSCEKGWEAAVAAQQLDQVKPCGPEQP
jgi:4'-phosphopantetheinyl transferase